MSKSLLIVDDDKNILEIIAEVLTEKFENIQTCTTVEEAIVIINSKKIDLIILDINLEGRNGAEIIKHIISDEKNLNKETPVLISSGIINQSFITKNRNRFAGIILKPFEHEELIELVDQIVSGKIAAEILVDDGSGIPNVTCTLPFTIPQLETKVNKVMEGIKKNGKLKDLFANMKINREGDNYIFEHIGMLINISTAISIALEWSTEKTLEKFVYAAYLHDMALNERTDLAKITSLQGLEDLKATLSNADYKLVFDHPTIAALKIEEFSEIPIDVAQIVRQHHETPKERGFPNKIGATKITPLASVFIVAHDLTDFILLNPNWTIEKFFLKFKMTYKGQHFNKILQALEKLK